MFLAFAFYLLSLAARLSFAKTPQQIQADLSKLLSNGSEVVLTSSSLYASDFTQRWTIYDNANPSFAIAAKPGTIDDLQSIVKYAIQNEVPILATGGGHGYSVSIGGVNDALDINLGNFANVSVDAFSNTMTVGGATIFRDVYDPLYSVGKQIPTGSSSSPGMWGVTSGAGIGPLTGEHGLVIDSLLSVRMVTGTGQILNVSATQDSDLFWGLRGAGTNFGIVTSATYRIYDQLNNGNVYNADLVFPGEQNGTIWKILQTYQGTQDGKLALHIGSSLRDNTPAITVSAIYYGTEAQGNASIKAFLDLGPTQAFISDVPYNKLVSTANFGADIFASQKGILADLWGYQLSNLTVPTLVNVYNELIEFLLDNPAIGGSSVWVVEKFGLGVTAKIADDSTAYPWRSAVSYGFFEFNFPANQTTLELQQTVDTFAKNIRSTLTHGCGNPEGNVYVNYARGDETPEQVYGASKLPRLQALKEKYDPHGLFNQYNAFA